MAIFRLGTEIKWVFWAKIQAKNGRFSAKNTIFEGFWTLKVPKTLFRVKIFMNIRSDFCHIFRILTIFDRNLTTFLHWISEEFVILSFEKKIRLMPLKIPEIFQKIYFRGLKRNFFYNNYFSEVFIRLNRKDFISKYWVSEHTNVIKLFSPNWKF